jgi:hypothetical protein
MELKEYVKQYITAQIKRHSIPIENQSYIDTWAERITNAARKTKADDDLIRESLNDQCRIIISGGTIKIDKTGTRLKEVGAAIANNEPRPIAQLRKLMALMPDLSEHINYAFEQRQIHPTEEWPPWCFIPGGLWAGIYTSAFGHERAYTTEGMEEIMLLRTLGTWRYSQGIYEFAPEIYDALVESDMSGKLPVDVFFRLPEWCVYIATPNFNVKGYTIHGFYALVATGTVFGTDADLHIVLDTDDGLRLHIFPLRGESIESTIRHLADTVGSKDTDGAKLQTMILTPIISLLLYLCSDAPEIDHTRKPGLSPFRAYAKKVKGALKMFPVSAPQIWTVGAASAEKLRGLGYGGGSRDGHRKRPHLRRGHWHGFWTGPRSGNRTFNYKWLPPMIVAAGND